MTVPISELFGIHPGVSSRQAQVQAYYQQFLDADGQSIATGYLNWAGNHPTEDAATAAQAFADSLAARGIGNAVSAAGNAVGKAQGQINTGTAKGLENASASLSSLTAVPNFLSRLTSPNTWLRVAEVGLGIMLILIGIDKLGNLDVSGKIAKVGKVAAFA